MQEAVARVEPHFQHRLLARVRGNIFYRKNEQPIATYPGSIINMNMRIFVHVSSSDIHVHPLLPEVQNLHDT